MFELAERRAQQSMLNTYWTSDNSRISGDGHSRVKQELDMKKIPLQMHNWFLQNQLKKEERKMDLDERDQ
jgi:hypothetical protein